MMRFRSLVSFEETNDYENQHICSLRDTIGQLIKVLEHNEECRLSWMEGVGGRLDRGNKVDLEFLNTMNRNC